MTLQTVSASASSFTGGNCAGSSPVPDVDPMLALLAHAATGSPLDSGAALRTLDGHVGRTQADTYVFDLKTGGKLPTGALSLFEGGGSATVIAPDALRRAEAEATQAGAHDAGSGKTTGSVLRVATRAGSVAGAAIILATPMNDDKRTYFQFAADLRGYKHADTPGINFEKWDGRQWVDIGVSTFQNNRGDTTFDAQRLERAYGRDLPDSLTPTRRTVSSLPDVQGLDKKGETKRDDTCAPKGTHGEFMVVSRPGMKEAERNYQNQITHLPDLPNGLIIEYRVIKDATLQRVDMDGCATWSPAHELLEAKYGSAGLHMAVERSNSDRFESGVFGSVRTQAKNQKAVIGSTHPVVWHVSDVRTVSKFAQLVSQGTGSAANFHVVHTNTKP